LLIGILARVILRLAFSDEPIMLLLASLIVGQVASIIAMAWLIANPMGKTRIEIAASAGD
jgi:hypothetical protein